MLWDDQKKVWFQNYVGDGSFLLRKDTQPIAKAEEDGRRPNLYPKKANRGQGI